MIKSTHFCLQKSIRQVFLVGLSVSLAACNLFRPYAITPLARIDFPPTDSVTIIHQRPQKKHMVLAEFVGREPHSCPEGNEFCTLRAKSKAAGAHAIWIQKTDTYRHPGDWIMVEDRLTRIYPVTINTYRGVLIRYNIP